LQQHDTRGALDQKQYNIHSSLASALWNKATAIVQAVPPVPPLLQLPPVFPVSGSVLNCVALLTPSPTDKNLLWPSQSWPFPYFNTVWVLVAVYNGASDNTLSNKFFIDRVRYKSLYTFALFAMERNGVAQQQTDPKLNGPYRP